MQSIFRQFCYCIEITFIIFGSTVVQWVKMVSLKWGCESTNKTSKFYHCPFWFRWNDAAFFIIYFFWVNDETQVFNYFGWYKLAFILMYYIQSPFFEANLFFLPQQGDTLQSFDLYQSCYQCILQLYILALLTLLMETLLVF